MTSGMHVLLSGAVTMGVPLVLAVGQLIALKRKPRGGGGPPSPPPVPPLPKPLPDCLIPRRTPALPRTRVLEDA